MNVVKRLLNVMSLVCLLFVFVGLKDAIDEYNKKRIEREESCRRLTPLGAVQDGSDPNPFWRYLPDADGKTIDEVIASTKAQCDKKIHWIQPYGSAKTVVGSAASLAALVAVLNYILLGKITLWNRVSGSDRAEKPK